MAIAVHSAYQESSQFQRWSLTADELARRRAKANAAAIELVKSNIKQEEHLSGKKSSRELEFPSTEEAELLVNYYASKVFETGSVYNLPSHLKATAATYLKRFYLSMSPLQYHPKKIMITSLFLATKTCEHHINLEDFVTKIPNLTTEGVLEYEFLISSTILFDFVHWSPFRPLYGFVLDMEVLSGDGQPVPADVPEHSALSRFNLAHDSAKAFINGCVWTDLAFLYSPSHIALAALNLVIPADLDAYLERKGLTGLKTLVEEVAEKLLAYSKYKFDASELKKTDKKLYYASDPALNKTSALFKKTQAADEAKESAKRKAKGLKAESSQQDFGALLS